MESKDILAIKEVAGALNSIPVAGKAYMSLMYNCIATLEAIAEKYRQAQEAAEAAAGMVGSCAGMAEAAPSAATHGAGEPIIGQ